MQSTMEKTLAAKNRLAEVNRILEKNNYSESRLIPILQEVQEVYKYLSKEIISYVATAIGVPPSRVYGVATFYAHFAAKDELLKALCEDLFGHIIRSALDSTHTHGLYSDKSAPASVFCHLLHHLQENRNTILALLSCESGELFLRYFRASLNTLVQSQCIPPDGKSRASVPPDFLVNHISGSFVEMVLWWIQGRMRQTPEELDGYFRAVIAPLL